MPSNFYVPILKGKEGEFAALEELGVTVKRTVMPLVELPPVPLDFETNQPTKSIAEYLTDIPARLKRACSGLSFYLDARALLKSNLGDNEVETVNLMLQNVATLGAEGIPVISPSTPIWYRALVHDSLLRRRSGGCVRLLVSNFSEESDLEADLNGLMESAGLEHSSTDLLIDLEYLGEDSGKAAIIARSVLSMIPHKELWRRLILAAASFPQDLSDVTAATTVLLPRLEWQLWTTLQKRPTLLPTQNLIYGDYAMAHPLSKTLDPRTMQMSANIRYTTPNAWLIVKGRTVKKYGYDQYFDLCRELIARPEYSGRLFSWGDSYINDCAEELKGPGNATTWRKVGVNHHVSLVARELANYSHEL